MRAATGIRRCRTSGVLERHAGARRRAKICNAVSRRDLHNNCVFDVATTGTRSSPRGTSWRRSSGCTAPRSASPATCRRPVRTRPNVAARQTTSSGPADRRGGSPSRQPCCRWTGPTDADRRRHVLRRRRADEAADGAGRAGQCARHAGAAEARRTQDQGGVPGGGKLDYHSSSSANLLLTVGRERDGVETG